MKELCHKPIWAIWLRVESNPDVEINADVLFGIFKCPHSARGDVAAVFSNAGILNKNKFAKCCVGRNVATQTNQIQIQVGKLSFPIAKMI